jgi:hypothetical protein
VARRIKPDIPPGAAKKIAKALDNIDAPKPRKARAPSAPRRPRSDPNAGVPGAYRPVRYGDTPESRIAQQARLNDGNRSNVYGGMSMDYDGRRYSTHGRSSGDVHAEGDMMDRMRRDIADHQNRGRPPGEHIRPEDVDLRRGSNAQVYVEYSPCDTRPRYCQDQLRDSLPGDTQVSYSWPWQPRDVRDQSRADAAEAIGQLFQRGTPGPT